MKKKKKYFITGGAGFIGSHLAERLLRQGHFVTAYDNLSNGRLALLENCLNQPRFRLIRGSVLDGAKLRTSLRKHDFVFHLAANSDIMASMNDPRIDFDLGIQATFSVLEAMRKCGIRRLAYTSGSGVYGERGYVKVNESHGDLKPISMYGAAKLASEGMISAYSHLYGIQAWIFRPANIIGSKPTHGIIFDLVRKLSVQPKKLDVLGDGSQSKSYLHVDDFLDAVLLVIRKAKQELNVFNVASRSSISVREIVELILKEMRISNVRICYGQANRGWRGDVPIVRMDIERLSQLGWKTKLTSAQAVRLAIREVIADCCASR